MKAEYPLATADSCSETERTGTEDLPMYTVVTQVKSNRVVYFTDDPDYAPPMDGDWYYLSSYRGSLPDGMTLRNCWSWRFNGSVFVDAHDARAKPRKEALLDHNREALLGILREKIDAVRAPLAPTCVMGEPARRAKLAEAQAFLNASNSLPAYPLLEGVATARNLSLAEAAELVQARARQSERILLETEFIREQMAAAIRNAATEAELLRLREWLLDQVYPELTRQTVFKRENTRPPELDAPLPAAQLVHEQARLRVQLRERINQQRAGCTSEYLMDDVMLKHKGKLAELLLAHGGEKTAGVDFAVLEQYADAHGLTLPEAARGVLAALGEAGRLLAETERTKDRLLARIAAVRTLRDVRAVSAEIAPS